MLPSPSRSPIVALLGVPAALLVISMLWLVPARSFLAPLWPSPIDEVLVESSARNSAARVFLPGGDALSDDVRLVARNRPWSVVVVDRVRQPPLIAYWVGIRSDPSGPLAPIPRAAQRAWVSGQMLDQAWMLEFVDAAEKVHALPARQVRSLFRPNQLTWAGRARVLFERLRLEWRLNGPGMAMTIEP